MITYSSEYKIVCDSLQGLIYGQEKENSKKDSKTQEESLKTEKKFFKISVDNLFLDFFVCGRIRFLLLSDNAEY